jgi:hypothetical protein
MKMSRYTLLIGVALACLCLGGIAQAELITNSACAEAGDTWYFASADMGYQSTSPRVDNIWSKGRNVDAMGQLTSYQIVAGDEITASVDAANDSLNGYTIPFRISLTYDGNTGPLGEWFAYNDTATTAKPVGGEDWQTFTYSFTVPTGASYIGKSLGIRLTGLNNYYMGELCYDNVHLSVTSVPEPSTLALLAAGLLGLLAYAWRKRR